VETALRNVAYVPAGLLVDRVGRSRCMIGSLSICLVSVPLFVCASGFWPILLIRLSIAVANAAFTPACAALLADLVPRQMRGRVMAAMGRGTVMIGAASGGTGGPGLGFLVTVPLMIASFSAGYLYAHNPAYPWYVAFVAIALCLLLTTLYVRDPQQAHV
jgi:MFS family permease